MNFSLKVREIGLIERSKRQCQFMGVPLTNTLSENDVFCEPFLIIYTGSRYCNEDHHVSDDKKTTKTHTIVVVFYILRQIAYSSAVFCCSCLLKIVNLRRIHSIHSFFHCVKFFILLLFYILILITKFQHFFLVSIVNKIFLACKI